MKSDVQMKADVEAELDWDRAINATNVGVSAHCLTKKAFHFG